MAKVRRIECEPEFIDYLQRSLLAMSQIGTTYARTEPWKGAVAGMGYILASSDPRWAAYCTTAKQAGLPAQTLEESGMDCMEFCQRRVKEVLALQGLETLTYC